MVVWEFPCESRSLSGIYIRAQFRMKLGLFYDYHEGLAFEVELGVTVEPPRWGRPGGAAEV